MRSHRRKWGWWLVAALAVVVAASLFLRKCSDTRSGQKESSAPAVEADSSTDAPVVRDTVYVKVEGETVPVVLERKVEKADTPASEETVIALPVSEVAGFIREKSGRNIGLTTSAPDRISVSYAGKVDLPLRGEQNMDFSADFKVVEVKDNRLVLQLDSGTAMNLAADLVAPLILERLPAGLVESFSSGRAVVNLSAVPQLKKRLSNVSFTGISVDESTIRFTTVPK